MRIKPIFVTLFAVALAWAASDPGYHLLKTISLTGDGGQDYLTIDQSARRLYVTHGIQVEVVDLDSEQPVGKIEGMNGVHGVALAATLGHGFVTSGLTKTVRMFDLKTPSRWLIFRLPPMVPMELFTNLPQIAYSPLNTRVAG